MTACGCRGSPAPRRHEACARAVFAARAGARGSPGPETDEDRGAGRWRRHHGDRDHRGTRASRFVREFDAADQPGDDHPAFEHYAVDHPAVEHNAVDLGGPHDRSDVRGHVGRTGDHDPAASEHDIDNEPTDDDDHPPRCDLGRNVAVIGSTQVPCHVRRRIDEPL
jgi:hypothetical protein